MRIAVGPRPFSISYSLLTLAPSPPPGLFFFATRLVGFLMHGGGGSFE
jgi:hypothetical protein